jgi:hypothetical protein
MERVSEIPCLIKSNPTLPHLGKTRLPRIYDVLVWSGLVLSRSAPFLFPPACDMIPNHLRRFLFEVSILSYPYLHVGILCETRRIPHP